MKKTILNKQVNTGLTCILLLFAAGCNPHRNLVYFSDLPQSTDFTTSIMNYTSPKIQPNDILDITVSSLNPESNVLFNNILLPATGNAYAIERKLNEGYLVDKDGAINFPVIGKISLGGLTKEEATEKLTGLVQKHVKDPIVNIRYLNFKVTVIGEVNTPNSFIIDGDKVNVLEALGLAGDMTEFGRRENVLVIREIDGKRTTARINLNNKDVLNSPFFYLQQNDIIYVEPDNKVKVAQTAPGNRYIGVWAGVISAIAFGISTYLVATNTK